MNRNRHRNRYLKHLSLLFLSASTSTSLALSSDANLPYHFKSDSILYKQKQHETVYLGHVRVIQGSTKIRGDKLLVQYQKDGKVKRMIDTGNLAHYSTLPDHKQKRLYAQAKKITFNPITHIALLEHQARVIQEKNVFTGPHIWYDMAAGVVRTIPGRNQKTVIVIQPQGK